MRRKDREIADLPGICAIMDRCQAVSVAFAGEAPYVVPMSFGFSCEQGRVCLYLHCAGEGQKLARLDADPHAAFAMYTDMQIIEGAAACRYSTTYASVCGSGMMRRLSGEDKRLGLERIMAHYAPGRSFTFEEQALDAVTVLCLEAEQISGKRRPAME